MDAVTPAAHAAREDRAAEAHGELRAAQPGVQRSLLRSSYSERGHRGPDTGLWLGGPWVQRLPLRPAPARGAGRVGGGQSLTPRDPSVSQV